MLRNRSEDPVLTRTVHKKQRDSVEVPLPLNRHRWINIIRLMSCNGWWWKPVVGWLVVIVDAAAAEPWTVILIHCLIMHATFVSSPSLHSGFYYYSGYGVSVFEAAAATSLLVIRIRTAKGFRLSALWIESGRFARWMEMRQERNSVSGSLCWLLVY